MDQPIQDITNSVEIQKDAQSTISSITDNVQADDSSVTTKLVDNSSLHQEPMELTDNNSTSTVSSVKTSILRQAIDPSLSAAQNIKRVTAIAQLKKNRLEQRESKLLAELETWR